MGYLNRVVIAAVASCLVAPILSVASLAQSGDSPRLSVDLPVENATVPMGERLFVGGWAVDPAGSSALEVDVYLDGAPARGGILLGKATYGTPRPDVATQLQRPGWDKSGFGLLWTTNVGMGPHRLFVQARSGGGITTQEVPFIVGPSICNLARPCIMRADFGGWIIDDGQFLHFDYGVTRDH
ncbi:MAG: hypothetical protein HW416_2588 [Chloroflexi bacterium]|nr:hypothetical protein [Chloroflexota bacterium]